MSDHGSTPYSKSFDDELDWTMLDQLHKAVLQIGTFCFRTKQVCLTVQVAVAGLLVRFTDNRLDQSVFVAGAAIPVGFWFLDGVAYYYQTKLRGLMNGIQGRLRSRNQQLVVTPTFERAIAEGRASGTQFGQVRQAFINHSMWLYALLLLADLMLWAAYAREWIG